MDKARKRKIMMIENQEKEKNFPKNPDDITGRELKEHFDLNNDGKVNIEEYAEHIKYHCENPETLQDELEQAEYQRGFMYEKGGVIRKGDYVRDARGQLGLVNKVSRGVAYVKYPSTNAHAFEPVFVDTIRKTNDFHRGRPVYSDFYDKYARGGEIKVKYNGELYGVKEIKIEEEDDILDKGTPYLVLDKQGKLKYNDLKSINKRGDYSVTIYIPSEDEYYGIAENKTGILIANDDTNENSHSSVYYSDIYAKGGDIKRRTRVVEYPYTSHLVVRDAVKDLKEFEDYEYGANRAGYATIEIDAKHLDRIYSNLAQYGGEAELIDEKVYYASGGTTTKGVRSPDIEYKKGGLTPEKASKMLEDGKAQGEPLTDKQKRYFHSVANENEKKVRDRARRKKLERGGKITLADYLSKKEKNNPKPETYTDTFIDEDTGEEVMIERKTNTDDFLIKDSPSQKRRERKYDKKTKKLFDKILNLKWVIRSLEDDLKMVEMTIQENIRETEQTAEPEGGPTQSRLGVELEDLQRRKIAITKLIVIKNKDLTRLEMNKTKVEEDYYDRNPYG